MTEDEKKYHAQRIIQYALVNVDFSDVYEDEALMEASEEDWGGIYDLISKAGVTVSWEAA